MTEETLTLLTSIIGLFVLLIGFIALTVKSGGKRVVSWRGFGVVFEIKPCTHCRHRKE